jgi:hypothetical protein
MGHGEFEQYAEQALKLRLDAANSKLADEFDGIYEPDAIRAMLDES